MNKYLLFICTVSLNFMQALAQEIKVLDELESPIKEAHIVSLDQKKHAFTNKFGLVDLSAFDNTENLEISHPSFIPIVTTKRKLKQNNNSVILLFNSETLGEIVLLTRIEDENLKTTADRRVVLHEKEITRLNTQTTADLLEKRAGINVQKSQMGGGSPVIRGFEANRILLVIDGVRLNNAIYRGGHLHNIISVDNASLEQVEIIFGPSSSEYSSDGLGGVIHLHTKRPKFTKKPRFKQNYNTRFASANRGLSKHYDLSYTSSDFSIFTSFSTNDFDDLKMGKVRTHGYEDWGKVYHYIEEGEQKENEDPNRQKNTGYNQTDFMQKAILRLSDKLILTGNFQYSTTSNIPRFDKLNDYGTINYDPIQSNTIYEDLKYETWSYGPQKRTFYSTQFDYSVNNLILDSAQLIFAYQDVTETRFVQKTGAEERIDQHENVDIYSINANFRKNNINYGFEYYSNEVVSKAFTIDADNVSEPYDQSRYPNNGSSMSSWAAYLTYRKNISDKLKLNTGVRYTENELNGKYIENPRATIILPYSEINNKYDALTANISLAYFSNNSWKIAAIASSGFHAPNLDDVSKVFYKGNNLTVPNFNLAPEYANTIELNITKNINNRILLNTNAYYTALNDAIMRVETSLTEMGVEIDQTETFTDVTTNRNTGQAEIFGATVSASFRIASNYTIETDYTLIKGKNKNTGLPFTHIPPNFGKTALYADFDKWRASLYTIYNGKKPINEYDLISGTDNEEESPIEWEYQEESDNWVIKYQGTPAWYTVNMSFMYRFTDTFTLQMALENILDHHYKTFASGLSAPGRNFILTLRTTF